MAELRVRSISKSFGGVEVLKGIDLAVNSGEFFTLLGPSGCGKTTLMRTVAGFLTPDGGEVHLGGERLDTKPAHKRDIGMVFQDYAVFPHLTVADNVAFGLKTRGVARADIPGRVNEALRMVHLDGLADRFPSEMSGGQQQRVGLARAVVIRPKLLLMDEPLSNLDAKLRLELRDDIRDLQKRLGVTTIYVTHDQEEALAISDRIAVMNFGVAEQIGAPREIYRQPRRRFAANFVGSMNFIPCEAREGVVRFAGRNLALAKPVSGPVEIAIRPEHVTIAPEGVASKTPSLEIRGTLRKFTYLGSHAQCAVTAAHGDVLVQIKEPDGAQEPVDGPVTLHLPLDRLFVFESGGDAVEILA